MIPLFLQLVGMALLGGSDEMDHAANERERETIAALKRGDATVREENGSLTVFSARSDKLIELAARLQRMRSLQASWSRSEPELKGPELRHLRGHKNLREINIHAMPISGEHFEVLTTLPNLEILRCEPQGNVKEALEHIGKCKGLRVLTLNYAQIADEDLDLLRGLEQLEELEFLGAPVSSGVRVVRYMKKLKKISLSDTRVDDETLDALKELPQLEALFLSSPNLTDKGMVYLAKCTNLRTLAVGSDRVTPSGVRHLVGLSKLTYLDLRVPLSDATLFDSLPAMTQLTNFVCKADGISAEARRKFQALLPKCRTISWLETQEEEAK